MKAPTRFDRRWILHEDAAVIAVDKPAGVPSQEARAGAADDLPARVRAGLGIAYLGVHQRLDAETSGVILYAKETAANASLAAQFEGRAVRKTYVAGVVGWARGAVTLRDRMRDGRIDPRGKPAVTHVREIARRGERALVECVIETGRTHQIRAQLAHAGAPIAGDEAGAPAARLMLHARSIELAHPIDGRVLRVEAPVPRDLEAWLDGIDPRSEPALIAAAIERAAQRRLSLAGTDAFRLLDEGDGLPGCVADVYRDWIVLQRYDEGAPEDALADALAPWCEGVYVRRRPRKASDLDADALAHAAPPAPIRGRAAPDELVVREGPLEFAVRLGDGLSTGLFLDQRENRARVCASSGGARVLNLFAYTCGFTVAAAAGGARETVSVDASAPALDRGRDNLARNGFAGDAHRLVRADAFEWLARARRRGERFDLVIVDPPTYSTTKKSRWTSGADWQRLAAAALALVAPGGALLATSNDRRMTREAFRRHVRAGAEDARVELGSLRDAGAPFDFRPPQLRGVLARRAR